MSTDNRQITTVVSQQQEGGVWGFQPCRGQEKKGNWSHGCLQKKKKIDNTTTTNNPLDQVNNNHWVKKKELEEGNRVMGHWSWLFSAAKTKKQNTGCENRNQVSSCDTEQLQACCHKSECVSPLLSGSFHPSQRVTCSPSPPPPPNHSLTHCILFSLSPPCGRFWSSQFNEVQMISGQLNQTWYSYFLTKVCKLVNWHSSKTIRNLL